MSPPEARGHLGDALSGLLDGELGAAQQDAAQAHLAGCPACARELSAVRQARTWVRALPPVDPPSGFYERVLEQGRLVSPAFGRQPFGRQPFGRQAFGGRGRPGTPADPAAARAQLRRRAGAVAVGAAAAAVTVLGMGSPQQTPVSPAVPRFVEAHASSASVGAELLSKLAPMGVPVSFGR